MPNVNPNILRWARTTAGLTEDEAAEKIGLRAARGVAPDQRLRDLEAGTIAPSRPLLLRMAKQYRRPLLTFYLPEPPRTASRGEDFRTLPEDELPETEAILDALLRDVKTRQAIVRAALEDDDEAAPLPFIGGSTSDQGTEEVVAAVRRTIPMPLLKFREAPNPAAAFAVLRDHAEDAGIFVLLMGDLGSHHTALDVDTFRGFALADPIAPFIVINDRDSRQAWSFTLVHEFTHLLLGQTGVSGGAPELDIERFCNDVASEYLLPSADLTLHIPTGSTIDEAASLVTDFATPRNVSSSMVAYKLFRTGRLTATVWRQLRTRYQQMWFAERERSRSRTDDEGGPNHYVVRRHRLGAALVTTTARLLATGALTSSRAAQVLGMKPYQLPQILAGTRIANRAS